MKPTENKPRVLAAMPTRGCLHFKASLSAKYLATRGACDIIPCFSDHSSILSRAFNNCWAQALEFTASGIIDYFFMHHDDIEVLTPGFVDVMLAEQKRTGAAVISANSPLKGRDGQETSTAMHQPGTWNVRKLRLDDIARLPETFCAADIDERLGLPGDLLVNTGVMLVDMHRPEFLKKTDGFADYYFSIEDRIRVIDEVRFSPESWSEDWRFSAQCNRDGLPVYATSKVKLIHHGGGEWSNEPRKESA